jgi:peptidyl-prolyl cis-trans isomerase SurA
MKLRAWVPDGRWSPRVALPALALLLWSSTACPSRKATGAEVLAEVNGRTISASEVEKFYQQQVQDEPQKPVGEQENLLRLNVLQSLIEREIMLQRAEKLGLLATDAEVINRFTEIKSPYTEEEFAKQLQQRGLKVDELKDQIRREESVKKLMNKEITSRITITDAEIQQFFDQNRASFNVPETRYHLAQILVSGSPTDPYRNLKNDKAKNETEARQKIEMLAGRLRNGEEFGQVAQSYSEDPNSAPNGGDLGFVPVSALDKTDPELKKAILILETGQTTKVVHSRQGYHLVKLIQKEPAGQRQFSDPAVQQSIRNTLLGRKEQLLKAAYYEELRNQAKIVNYYVRRVLEAGGKK